MPEISEVKLTAEFVTQANKNRTIENVSFLKTNKLKLIEEIIMNSTMINLHSARLFITYSCFIFIYFFYNRD